MRTDVAFEVGNAFSSPHSAHSPVITCCFPLKHGPPTIRGADSMDVRHDSHDSAQGPGLETWRATLGDFPGGRLGRPTRIHFWAVFFHVFPCSSMPNT